MIIQIRATKEGKKKFKKYCEDRASRMSAYIKNLVKKETGIDLN